LPSGEAPIVLLGAGQCSASAASALRARGFDGPIVLVGAEPELPYERPPLSKGYLVGEVPASDLAIRPAAWYAENEVEVRLGVAAEHVDPSSATVALSDGERLGYDRLLIATGARPRQLPGCSGERILSLRTRADSDRLTAALSAGEELVILGGGFIGCEVAASARSLGVGVTVLEMEENPLQGVLGRQVAQVLGQIHRDAGVKLRTEERVLSVREGADGLEITTDRGRLECSRLLVAIGAQPNSDFLAPSPVACDNGVLVDEYCRTNVERIFAAGDVSAHHHPVFDAHIRVEHYDNAVKQGAAAAASMLGAGEPFEDPHWFWSDQYTHKLQSVGIARGWDEAVIRGDVDALDFSVFYLREGTVVSVFAINRPGDVSAGRRMVHDAFRPDVNRLRDTGENIKRMMTAAGSAR
jgi:3-phenylpropionate/trans-cinnamate dioxygenase ferredoxin reductase subunit